MPPQTPGIRAISAAAKRYRPREPIRASARCGRLAMRESEHHTRCGHPPRTGARSDSRARKKAARHTRSTRTRSRPHTLPPDSAGTASDWQTPSARNRNTSTTGPGRASARSRTRSSAPQENRNPPKHSRQMREVLGQVVARHHAPRRKQRRRRRRAEVQVIVAVVERHVLPAQRVVHRRVPRIGQGQKCGEAGRDVQVSGEESRAPADRR